MLIASKYEEIWAPEVNDFVYISDKAYTRCALTQLRTGPCPPSLTAPPQPRPLLTCTAFLSYVFVLQG
jgi:hypothetical protein